MKNNNQFTKADQKNSKLVPYLVDVSVSQTKTVVIWEAADAEAWVVEEAARDMMRDRIITMAPEDGDCNTEAEVTGQMPADQADCYQHYGEHGCIHRGELEFMDSYLFLMAKDAIRKFCTQNYRVDYTDGQVEAETFQDLTKIPIAWTDYEEGSEEHPQPYDVSVYIDLVGCSVTTFVNKIQVSAQLFESLADLYYNFLEVMDYDSIIDITDEEWDTYYLTLLEQDNVAGVFPPKRQRYVDAAKRKFTPGTRVLLHEMARGTLPETKDLPVVPGGTYGCIKTVDDAGHLCMIWDNGSTLPLIPGVDKFTLMD